MNNDVKEKWVAALRSGEYEQGTRMLSRDNKFCCLGVLCKLSGLEFSPERGYLPDSVVKWAGLDSISPGVVKDGVTDSLAYLNDVKGLTFNQIADLIEEQL